MARTKGAKLPWHFELLPLQCLPLWHNPAIPEKLPTSDEPSDQIELQVLVSYVDFSAYCPVHASQW